MKRCGVYSAYAISLLVLLTMGLTGIVYNYMNASSNVLLSNAEYTITAATISGIQYGTLAWYDIVLQNTGTQSFVQTILSVDINGVTYNLLQNMTKISPNQILEQKGILNATVVLGKSYTVKIAATTSDGSTFIASRQISAS